MLQAGPGVCDPVHMCYFVTLTKPFSSFDGKHLWDCHVAARIEPHDEKLIERGSRVLCVLLLS